jgi:hypothetical protein
MEPITSGSSVSSGSSFAHTDTAAQHETTSGTPDVIGQAKQTAGQMVGQVKQQASVRLSSQFEQAAEGLSTASGTIRDVSQQLRENGQEPLAEIADRAAHRVEYLSTYLRGKDLDALVMDVEHFARRQPQMFIAGALGLGMLAARFLKSAPERTETRIMGTDSMSTPRFTPGWRSPTEYHGLDTPTPSSGLSSGMSTSSPSVSTPSTSTPSVSTPSSSIPPSSTPSTSTPTTSSSSSLGTSPTTSKPDDVPQPTEPMKPLNRPTTGDQDSELRRSA